MSKTRALIFLCLILASCTLPTEPLPYGQGSGGVYDPTTPPTNDGNGGGITLPRIPTKPMKPY